MLKLTAQSIEISKFKLQLRKDLRTEFSKLHLLQDIQNSQAYKYLANDEIKAVLETKENAENYLYTLSFYEHMFCRYQHLSKNYFEKMHLFHMYIILYLMKLKPGVWLL